MTRIAPRADGRVTAIRARRMSRSVRGTSGPAVSPATAIAVAALRGRREQLLREERVALGALVDPGELRGRDRPPEDRPELGALFGRGQRPEVDALDARQPLEIREVGEQRVAGPQVERPERPDEEQPRPLHVADHELEEVARRRVAPVEVLEDEHERLVRGEALEEAEDQLEEPRLVGPGTDRRPAQRGECLRGRADVPPEPGRQRRELEPDRTQQPAEGLRPDHRPEGPERVEERPVRDPVAAQVEAGADDHPPSVGLGPRPELRHEPGLAEARVAADQDNARLARRRPLERGDQRGHRGVPSDEDRARERPCHCARNDGPRDGGAARVWALPHNAVFPRDGRASRRL